MTYRCHPAFSLGALCGFLFISLCATRGQSGITNEAGLTLFRTGGTETLLTWAFEFDVPTTNLQPTLRLDFGFASSEPDAAGIFFDAFSLTLQTEDATATALLFTADRTGVQWAPSTPGGLAVETNSLAASSTNFPTLSPSHLLQFAFSLVFVLPPALTAGPITLFLDFFDNLDSAGSLAWVGNVRIDSLSPPVRLFSAPTPEGPYTEETGAVLDTVARTLTLARPLTSRFYRVVADRNVRVRSIRFTAAALVVEYEFVELRLMAAADPAGPYQEEVNVTLDPVARTLTLPKPGADRFFRVEGNAASRLGAVRAVDRSLVLEYELLP